MSDPLVIGRVVHYVSAHEPYIESPAIVLMAKPDYVWGEAVASAFEPTEADSVSLLVHGLVNDYREHDVEHLVFGEEGWSPRSWHWPHECVRRGAQE